MPILRNADPKPRYSSPQQAGLKAITDAEAEALTQMADFNTQLGINSDQGAFEASYAHLNSGEKGTLRVFFAVPGQDGVEGIKNLHETGMQNWWGRISGTRSRWGMSSCIRPGPTSPVSSSWGRTIRAIGSCPSAARWRQGRYRSGSRRSPTDGSVSGTESIPVSTRMCARLMITGRSLRKRSKTMFRR